MKTVLVNEFGTIRNTKIGFSWTMLFFGALVPLFRKDYKWFFLTLALDVVTLGVAWFVMPFIYNKIYLKELYADRYVLAGPNGEMKKAYLALLD